MAHAEEARKLSAGLLSLDVSLLAAVVACLDVLDQTKRLYLGEADLPGSDDSSKEISGSRSDVQKRFSLLAEAPPGDLVLRLHAHCARLLGLTPRNDFRSIDFEAHMREIVEATYRIHRSVRRLDDLRLGTIVQVLAGLVEKVVEQFRDAEDHALTAAAKSIARELGDRSPRLRRAIETQLGSEISPSAVRRALQDDNLFPLLDAAARELGYETPFSGVFRPLLDKAKREVEDRRVAARDVLASLLSALPTVARHKLTHAFGDTPDQFLEALEVGNAEVTETLVAACTELMPSTYASLANHLAALVGLVGRPSSRFTQNTAALSLILADSSFRYDRRTPPGVGMHWPEPPDPPARLMPRVMGLLLIATAVGQAAREPEPAANEAIDLLARWPMDVKSRYERYESARRRSTEALTRRTRQHEEVGAAKKELDRRLDLCKRTRLELERYVTEKAQDIAKGLWGPEYIREARHLVSALKGQAAPAPVRQVSRLLNNPVKRARNLADSAERAYGSARRFLDPTALDLLTRCWEDKEHYEAQRGKHVEAQRLLEQAKNDFNDREAEVSAERETLLDAERKYEGVRRLAAAR